MSLFTTNEGVFQLPDGWEDRSVSVISYPVGSAIPAASLTITRERLTDTKETLSSYVNGQLARLAKTCAAYQLIRHLPTELGGMTAEMADFKWLTPEKITVRQVLVVTFLKTQALVVTATSEVDRFAEFELVFQQVLHSFRVHDPNEMGRI